MRGEEARIACTRDFSAKVLEESDGGQADAARPSQHESPLESCIHMTQASEEGDRGQGSQSGVGQAGSFYVTESARLGDEVVTLDSNVGRMAALRVLRRQNPQDGVALVESVTGGRTDGDDGPREVPTQAEGQGILLLP